MLIKDLMMALNDYAPFETAEHYDNVGLIIGSGKDPLRGVVFALDATEAVVNLAIEKCANVVVCHHPLIFGGVTKICTDVPEGAIIKKLLANNIQLVAMHTNLDKAENGTAKAIADCLDLQDAYIPQGNDYMRIAQLEYPQTAEEWNAYVSEKLGFPSRLYGNPKAKLQTVAIAPGSAGDAHLVAFKHQAQAIICGEMKHHNIIDACARAMVVLENGHFANENPVMALLMQAMQDKFNDIPMFLFTQNPFIVDKERKM